MNEQENKQELRGKLIRAKDIEEVRALLGPETAEEEINQTWREIEAHRPADGMEAVDDDELAAVSGGADRDWEKEGCSATVEAGSWCGSDDACVWVDVTYSNIDRCPVDGYRHDWYESGWKKTTYGRLFREDRIEIRKLYRCRKCQKRKEEIV